MRDLKWLAMRQRENEAPFRRPNLETLELNTCKALVFATDYFSGTVCSTMNDDTLRYYAKRKRLGNTFLNIKKRLTSKDYTYPYSTEESQKEPFCR